MKFNLLIADDEYFIRQKIKKLVHYDELEIELVGDVEDGKQVLQCLEEQRIDILILDINMPFMDGVEVSKYIYDKKMDTEVIILSGYGTFEYAQAMMRNNVKHYLLKPISEETLNDTLRQTIDSINKRKHHKKTFDMYATHATCYRMNEVIKANESALTLVSDIPEIEDFKYFQFLSIYTNGDMERVMVKLSRFFEEREIFFVVLSEEINMLRVMLFFADEQQVKEKNIVDFVASLSVCKHYAVSEVLHISQPLALPYKENGKILNHRFFGNEKKKDYLDILGVRNNIIKLIRNQKEQDLEKYIRKTILSVSTYQDLRVVVNEVLMSFYFCSNNEYFANVSAQTLEILSQNDTLEGIMIDIFEFANIYFDIGKDSYSETYLCKKITAFVDDNYNDINLSTKIIATHMGLTSSYIGSVFKKVHKKPITQYITEVRLEAAKLLLIGGEYKISDIATMVGYSDAFYFSKRFKQFFGYSPKQQSKH